MKHYRSYLDRVRLDETAHRRILAALAHRPNRRRRYAALAACCGVVLLAGAYGLSRPAPFGLPTQTRQTGEALPPVQSPAVTREVEDTDGYTLVPEDPFQGQPHGFFNVPGIAYTDCTSRATLAASIALPQGSFQEEMTAQEIIQALGGTDEVPWSLLWAGFGLNGTVYYDGEGRVWQAVITGEREDESFTLVLAPDALPVNDVVYEGVEAIDYNGIPVYAYCGHYDRDGDGQEEYVTTLEFLSGETGARFTYISRDGDNYTWLPDVFARKNACPDGPLTVKHLVPDQIPDWRSEALTESQAYQEALGAWLPQAPAGFQFESAHRELGQGRDWLQILWTHGYDYVDITVSRPAEPPACMDPARRELYDVNLYTIPWADSVPDEVMFGGFQDPVFRAEDLTAELVAARAFQIDQDLGDTSGWRYTSFSVWHEAEGILVHYDCKGPAPQEIAALILPD